MLTRAQIKYEELSSFDEILAAGTAAALVPIKSIVMQSRNDEFKYQGGGDKPGPACVKFLTQLKAIQQGKTKDEFRWQEAVREYKPSEYEVDSVKTNGVNGHMPGQLP